MRSTIGLPNSGLSHQTGSSWTKTSASKTQVAIRPSLPLTMPASAGRSYARVALAGLAILVVAALWWVLGEPSSSPPQTAPSATTPPTTAPAVSAVTPGLSLPPVATRTPAESLPVENTRVAREPALPVVAPPPASANPPALAAPPVPLTREEVQQLQLQLKGLGFDPGPVDGLSGPLTLQAVRRYAAARGLPDNAEVTREILARLRSDGGKAR